MCACRVWVCMGVCVCVCACVCVSSGESDSDESDTEELIQQERERRRAEALRKKPSPAAMATPREQQQTHGQELPRTDSGQESSDAGGTTSTSHDVADDSEPREPGATSNQYTSASIDQYSPLQSPIVSPDPMLIATKPKR